ncbi:MAG: YecA family protein [Xanthomonadales bacterium]|nr:hypothetical protein [Xanthomonadales bacterium]MCC6591852.1 YecA family protein [Xanthomonadales bacterium]MCE7931974.1 YecA family protein [Xanthomonadales bacterium PRO6]
MRPPEPSVLLDEQDFEEIDRLLESLGADEGLRLDGAQGLLTAIIVGPLPVGPEHWLPVILGGEPLGAPSPRLQRLLDLLLRLQGNIAHGLDLNNYDPIFAEHESGGEHSIDASGWCQGFSLGVDLNAETWEQRMQEDRSLLDLLAPVVALGVDDGVFAEVRNHEQQPLSERERDLVVAQLGSILTDVRQYWQEHPPEDSAPAGATLH